MFGVSSRKSRARYGAIVDIGSGSVGAAIVLSDPEKPTPEVLWTHRERVALHTDDDSESLLRHVTAALVNVFLVLDAEQRTHTKNSSIDTLQVTFSAPWSHTITRTITHTADEPFSITSSLLRELVETAEQQTRERIDENEILERENLSMILRAKVHLMANGYPVHTPTNAPVQEVSLSHISGFAQKQLVAAVDENVEKMMPKTRYERYPFMLMYYCVLQHISADVTNACLVDVTYESIELGVVRNGVLTHVAHIPTGMYTIARDIARLCDLPTEEALGYVRGNTAFAESLSKDKKIEFAALMQSYEKTIEELFTRTGDALSIPNAIFLHTDARTEPFFRERIKQAAEHATSSSHTIHLVTGKLLASTEVDDSALLVSAHFFHKLHGCPDFAQV